MSATELRRSAALALLAACAFVALLSGAPWLESKLPGGLPVGNAVAALALSSLPALAVAASAPRGWLRRVSWTLLACALAWLPVSLLLAGNLALSFGGARGEAWLVGTLALLVGGACCALLALVGLLRRWFAQRSEAPVSS